MIASKTKVCKWCKGKFIPERPKAVCCSLEHEIEYGLKIASKSKAVRVKAERIAQLQDRKTIKLKLEKLKSIAELANEAQTEINRYVRIRDYEQGCISCDKPSSWDGQWHASHFKSRGSNSFLRFNLWNLHKSCSVCNNHLSGNIGEYGRRLPERIGQEKFEYLQTAQRTKTFTREYLIRLKEVFRKKANRLAKRKGL